MHCHMLVNVSTVRTSPTPPPTRQYAIPDDGTMNLFFTIPEYQIVWVAFRWLLMLPTGGIDHVDSMCFDLMFVFCFVI